MANRVLRDWTDSDRMNLVSVEAERFFTRLIMKADDFGYFHAHPSLVIAALFPLKIETVKSCDVDRWMLECERAGLVRTYEVNDRKYLQIKDFKQRLRNMVSKFPPPADEPPPSDGQPADIPPPIVGDPPPETKRNETEVETEKNPEDEVQKNEISDRLYDSLKTETGAGKETDGQTKVQKATKGDTGAKADPVKPVDGLTLFSDFDRLHHVLKLEETWIENTAKLHKLTVSGTRNKIADWVAMFKTQGEDSITLKEAKKYCSNWIGKNKTTTIVPESNRAYNKILPQT